MKVLTLDYETQDSYIDLGLGSGWVYELNYSQGLFKVLGCALKSGDNETIYTQDKQVVREAILSHDVLVCHNIAYDFGCLLSEFKSDTQVLGKLDLMEFIDTEILCKFYESHHQSYSLDACASRHLGVRKQNDALVDLAEKHNLFPAKTTVKAKWVKKNLALLQELSYDTVASYAMTDVDIAYQLYSKLVHTVDTELLSKYCYVIKQYTKQRKHGVRVDLVRARQIEQELQPIIASIQEELNEMYGKELNIGSIKQLAELMDKYNEKYPVAPYTAAEKQKIMAWDDKLKVVRDLKAKHKTPEAALKAGKPSIKTEWLEEQESGVCGKVAELRKLIKIKNDFITKIINMQEYTCPGAEHIGKVFPELNMMRARTGRFSCTSPNCFDDKTEILTQRGFRLFKDLIPEDRVAQWDDGEISFVAPLAYIEKQASKVYSITTQEEIDLCVTSDHRLLLETRQGKKEVVNVSNYNNDRKQLCAGTLKTSVAVDVNLDLIFAIQADGSLTKYGVDFIFSRGRKVKRFQERIAPLKLYPTKTGSRYRTLLKYEDIPGYVWNYIDRSTKRFTDEIVNLARVDILEYLMFWDGCWTRKAEWKSKHKDNCDKVQAMLVCSNFRARLGVHTVNGVTYHKVLVNHKNYSWTTNRKIKELTYSGKVYCVSVLSSYIVVRRNNCVAITGQCQQIPSDSVYGPMCRSIYLPDKWQKWYSLDYQNQEGRLQVHYANKLKCSGVSVLVQKFIEDPRLDMHQVVADIVGMPRKQAKVINLGLSYSMGISKLANALGVHENEAMIQRDLYHAEMPYLKKLIDKCKKSLEANKYIRTISGRKVTLEPATWDYERKEMRTWSYKALNMLIQGSAADQTILAMYSAFKAGLNIKLSVHDELVLSGDLTDAKLCERLMIDAVKMDVPVAVDIEAGNNWGELKSINGADNE